VNYVHIICTNLYIKFLNKGSLNPLNLIHLNVNSLPNTKHVFQGKFHKRPEQIIQSITYSHIQKSILYVIFKYMTADDSSQVINTHWLSQKSISFNHSPWIQAFYDFRFSAISTNNWHEAWFHPTLNFM